VNFVLRVYYWLIFAADRVYSLPFCSVPLPDDVLSVAYSSVLSTVFQSNHPRTNFNRGNALAFAGRLQAALDAFKQVLAENPQDTDAQYNHDLIEKLLKEQKNRQQKEHHQEGEQSRKEVNKHDQQQKSTNNRHEEQSSQSKQESSKENMESNNQNTPEAQNNVDEKESTAGTNIGKFKEGKDDSVYSLPFCPVSLPDAVLSVVYSAVLSTAFQSNHDCTAHLHLEGFRLKLA
jgi:tetratricopeptide (TPR) repeat protein